MKSISLRKSNAFVLIFSLLGLLYLVAYTSMVRRPKSDVVEIHFADRITEAHRALIDRYNALHAGKIKVIPIDFPNLDFSTNERKEILARSLRGEGDGIDLLAVDIIWVQRFAKWCEPLGKYFSEQELKRILPDALYTCYNDGELVALPLDVAIGVLYYREDLLKNVAGGDKIIRQLQGDMTWPDFLALRRKLGGKQPFYIFPGAEYEGMICVYIENLLSLKPDYFATYGFNFDTPEAKKVLQLMVDLVHKDGATPEDVCNFTEVPSYEYYVRNDGYFIRGWNTYDKDFKQSPYDARKEDQLRKAPLPYFPGGKPAAVYGGWDIMVSRFSKKKDAVVDFVKFLLSDEAQESFYTRSSYFPVTSSFYADSANALKYPELETIKRLMTTGVHRPVATDYTNYSKIMAHYFVLALRNKITVEQAVKSVTRAIQSAPTSVVAG